MLFVLVGWVIFRASTFGTAGSILLSLVGAQGTGGAFQDVKLLAAAAIAAVLIPSAHELKDQLDKPRAVVAVGAAVLAVFCVLAVGNGAPVNFIYFRF